jgi:hypothetical protein
MKDKLKRRDRWYGLDNAAKIFASIVSRRITTVFRLSATLYHPINKGDLGRAVINCLQRFPYYRVELRKALFWHYLQDNYNLPVIMDESSDPCQMISRKQNNKFRTPDIA